MLLTTSREWAAQAVLGDEQAFCQLVKACEHTLHAAALAITRSEQDALDCVQEAILKAWNKLPTLRNPEYFSTWLTRIVVTTAINARRKKKSTAPLLTEIPAPDGELSMKLDIRRAVESLDEKTRICTVLYYFEDMTVEQIARVTRSRQGTVKSRLFRARQQLRSVLEGYDHDE